MPVKCLVHGRRLVHASSNGLKIVDAESIRVHISIPAYYIKRVVEVVIWVNIVLFFDVKQKVAPLVNGL